MAATRVDLLAHYEGGESVAVVADQRDIAAFERAEKVGFPTALENMPIVALRFVAWHALRRTGAIDTKVTRDAWEATVVEVEHVDEQDAVPGNPEAPAEAS